MADTYSTIDNPYDSVLSRSEDAIGASLIGTDLEMQNENPSPQKINGNDLDDLWINKWIKSRFYKPGKSGFFLDGKTGNAELNNALFRGKVTFANDAKIDSSNIVNSAGWTSDATVNTLISNMGDLAYKDLVEQAMIDETLIVGGYLKTNLVEASRILAGSISGWTITGGVVRTAATGTRVVLEENTLKSYYSSASYPSVALYGESLRFTGGLWDPVDGTGSKGAYIYYDGDDLELHCHYGASDTVLTLYNSEGAAGISGSFTADGTIYANAGARVEGNINFESDGHGILRSSNWCLSFEDDNTVRSWMSFMPGNNGEVNCGDGSIRWAGVYSNYLKLYGSGSSAMTLGGDGTTMTVDKNFSPSSANSKYCGTSTNYWARVYGDAIYNKYGSLVSFDCYDDLQIIRDLSMIKDKKASTGLRIDASKLPKEISSDGFVNASSLSGFNLCVSKRIVECIDDLQKQIEDLTHRVDLLKNAAR